MVSFKLPFFFFNEPATTEIYTVSYTLSLHDALPISAGASARSSACSAWSPRRRSTSRRARRSSAPSGSRWSRSRSSSTRSSRRRGASRPPDEPAAGPGRPRPRDARRRLREPAAPDVDRGPCEPRGDVARQDDGAHGKRTVLLAIQDDGSYHGILYVEPTYGEVGGVISVIGP